MGSDVLIICISVGLVNVRYLRRYLIVILGASGCSIRFGIRGLVIRVTSQILFS